jgi:hypothetical protein
MSLFGSSHKTTIVNPPPKPTPAPPAPRRSDKPTQAEINWGYKRAANQRESYTKSMMGGSATRPTKSYAAQLYGTGTM